MLQLRMIVSTSTGDYDTCITDLDSEQMANKVVELFETLKEFVGVKQTFIPWYSIGIEYEENQEASREVYGDLFTPEDWALLCYVMPNIEYGYDIIQNVEIIHTVVRFKII